MEDMVQITGGIASLHLCLVALEQSWLSLPQRKHYIKRKKNENILTILNSINLISYCPPEMAGVAGAWTQVIVSFYQFYSCHKPV